MSIEIIKKEEALDYSSMKQEVYICWKDDHEIVMSYLVKDNEWFITEMCCEMFRKCLYFIVFLWLICFDCKIKEMSAYSKSIWNTAPPKLFWCIFPTICAPWKMLKPIFWSCLAAPWKLFCCKFTTICVLRKMLKAIFWSC